MPYFSSSEFKSVAKAGHQLPVIKQFAVTPTESGTRQIKFVVSTDTVDRDNDQINQDGWQLENYLKNPTVLWSHDASQLPVGKCVSCGIENGNLTAIVEFVPEEVPVAGPLAEAVMQLCQRQFLSAVSVGFRAIEWDFSDDPKRKGGVDFKSQELLEFSLVNLPSNPEALIVEASAPVEIAKEQAVTIELNTHKKNRLLMKMRILALTA